MFDYLRAFKNATPIITAAAVGLLIIAAGVWWFGIHLKPANVFWGALENNLKTTSVTKHIADTAKGQGIDQYIRLQTGSTNAAKWLVTLKQTNSTVVTESIGTPNSGYVRYVKASTNQKHADGSPYNFSKVLGTWAKADKSSADSLNQLFDQTVLDIGKIPTPPIGNLPPEQRADIMAFMQTQDVFEPQYRTLKKTTVDGRQVYTLDVKVTLMPYVRMMQSFARNQGLKSLQDADPTQFRDAKPITLQFAIDAAGHQIRSISYPDEHFTETYGGYGLSTPIEVPTNTISVSELQKRLQSL